MKKLTYALISFTLFSCQGKSTGPTTANGGGIREPAHFGVMDRMTCDAGVDAFKCIRFACQEAGGTYDQADKSCDCGDGKIFASQRGGICVDAAEVNDSTLRFENSLFRVDHYLRLKGSNISQMELTFALKNRSAPILPGTSSLTLFRTGEEFSTVNERMDNLLFSLAVFGMPTTYLEGVPLNEGVLNKIADRIDQFYFLPNSKKIATSSEELNQAISKALEKSRKEFTPESVVSVSKMACAEICTAKQVLLDDPIFKITRVRTYSSGNPINDQVNFFDKRTHFIEISISLINNYPSHYILRQNGTYNLFANDGVVLGAIAENRQLELGLRNQPPQGAPAILFEDGYNEAADRVALLGPTASESYYGWFSAADNRSFLFGKKTSEWGEDYPEAPEHADNVVKLASQDFQKPIIPFPSVSLINGDILNKLSTLPNGNLVASISFGIPYEKEECLKSPLAKTIEKSNGKILWVIGAGNSGTHAQTEGLVACPQILTRANTLLVAATAGKESLASSTTYGEDSVDIAESGCKSGETSCSGNAATSYAAPRAARAIADLTTRFPQHSPQQIRMAVILTARVPYEGTVFFRRNAFLDVRSGGRLDTQTATLFLEKFPPTASISLGSKEFLEALMAIKKGQYNFSTRKDLENLIQKQIERLKHLL